MLMTPPPSPAKPKLSLLIFDFDGVLVDTQQYVNEIQCRFLNERGLNIGLEEFGKRFSGLRINQIVETLQDEQGIKPYFGPIGLSKEMDNVINKELAHHRLTPFPGTVAALDALNHAEIKKCIASNCSEALLQYFVHQSGLEEYFIDRLYSGETVPQPKPAPDLFLYAAKCQGAEPSQCLVIEDSEVGVKAATAAGMRVVGFVAGSHIAPNHHSALLGLGAEAILNDLRQLPIYIGL